MYKAEEISLVGASKSTGGSLDNFVPSNYHLTGSTADSYVFSPGKTVEGYITYMMDDAKYEDFKANQVLQSQAQVNLMLVYQKTMRLFLL
ncbi:Uncharacterised protein [Listeria fleischmannii subsp. fleischmannii]|uniref:Uncharacterized protein n=1 Tax=Listeria fleischmannii subsp. fleischmannii TaxID=1671902 RepID=A0A2X3GWC0_9LIST|nr:DUF5068 domain-containing protein [Listeria fleischmannii]SQC64993.1 Uncharacterised protein [Listeria fleischmannii subsp. fleischmannii]